MSGLKQRDRELDRELLIGCRRGDRRSWRRLLDRYERLVFSIPLSYGLSREDAADIAQLTFTIFLQSADGLREDSNLKGWLATVARRHTWRAMGKRSREMVRKDEDLAEHAAVLLGEREDGFSLWEVSDWLRSGLERVSVPCRKLLFALYLDASQPSYAEVSEKLGVPVGSIGPTRARCLKKLRDVLEAESA
ncbi:sigma70-ECF: RNA polymerase sigma factor, sigma-70 family [Rubrobacter radiotolerans]|uniref:Sigma-70 family RNA polymerase sigma factor n=1 Tax=Rubrobacter radiotolerans TaxID=42256 RepID=A0A023X057_RUBRA|nr:sigma-70 family RNA polymerase sigma factor [Rubrobacter radiotolerans]AHY45718.1 sigma70-ECF: RNA polymerase sigma factor, sigma-70 family [Rubrobacter radiotolerans]MDX5893134.1 sigma-70 family RNA polymerase sigma factor [Rubrobacter radiotolerans]SMC03119.1 RNA polymerase sigma factor, sigma-70 family [Rubrobacter radiotolerans DSM 5868]